MIAALVHRELLSNLHTFRLAVALVFAVTLSALSTFIGSLDYSRNIDACEAEHRSINEHSASVSTYSELLPRIVIPPDPLSILSRGVLRTNGRTLYILLDYKIIAPWPIGAGFDNELMKALTQVDFTAVVAILLSFLAVVLGFDGICGELERGTLRQVLANPVPRTSLVLSKLIGGSLSLWVSLAVAYAVSLLIKVSNPDVHLTGDHWIRLGAYFLLVCLFLSKVFSLALLASSCTRNSDTSLTLCLFAWLVFGVGYVNLLPYRAAMWWRRHRTRTSPQNATRCGPTMMQPWSSGNKETHPPARPTRRDWRSMVSCATAIPWGMSDANSAAALKWSLCYALSTTSTRLGMPTRRRRWHRSQVPNPHGPCG